MIVQYRPSKGIIINGIEVDFFEKRDVIRKMLFINYEEENYSVSVGADHSEPLLVRRDIYKTAATDDFFFFSLNYNENDLLYEVEVHRSEKITIFDISFDFNDGLDFVALKLSEYSDVCILSEGEIFFRGLKMTLCDRRKMGSEGDSIDYFYCAADVTHLS